jgi:hypothetical protein
LAYAWRDLQADRSPAMPVGAIPRVRPVVRVGGIGVGILTAEESGVNRVESEVNRIASIETWNGSLSPTCTPAVIKSPERVRRARAPRVVSARMAQGFILTL